MFLSDLPLCLVHHYNVRLVGHLIGLYQGVLQDLCALILHHLWSPMSIWGRPTKLCIVCVSAHLVLYILPAAWLWHSMYAFGASVLHPAAVCWTFSGASLYSLTLGFDWRRRSGPLLRVSQCCLSLPPRWPSEGFLHVIHFWYLSLVHPMQGFVLCEGFLLGPFV